MVQSASSKKTKRLWKAYVISTPALSPVAHRFNLRAERGKDADPNKLFLWGGGWGSYGGKGNAWATKKGVMDAVNFITRTPTYYNSHHDPVEAHRPKLSDFRIIEIELVPTVVAEFHADEFVVYQSKS